MLIDIKTLETGLATVSISGVLNRASALAPLTEAIARLSSEGRRGVLLDLGKVRRLNMAGLAALVELVARHPHINIAFCALPEKQLAFLRKSGLDRGLTVFPSVEDAIAHPAFRQHALTGVRTVLLCADPGDHMAPLGNIVSKPMLDLAGRPVLQHLLERLGTLGLRDVLLNPGYLGYQIVDHVRHTPAPDMRITFVNEGRWNQDTWVASPRGSASTLLRMQVENAAFDSDFVVLRGDGLNDVDLVDMMRAHRASGADVTIAAAPSSEHQADLRQDRAADLAAGPVRLVGQMHSDQNHLADTGIYIFKPDVLSLLPYRDGLDIMADLLPAILTKGGKIHSYEAPFAFLRVDCGRSYAAAVAKCLQQELTFARPMGQEVRPGVWAMPGAEVSLKAEISGPCHVGTGARIEAGAHLDGVCSIGSGTVVEGGTVLRDTVVLPDTHVAFGVWADRMILHGDWAITHTYADGSEQDHTPLEGVTSVQPALPGRQRATA